MGMNVCIPCLDKICPKIDRSEFTEEGNKKIDEFMNFAKVLMGNDPGTLRGIEGAIVSALDFFDKVNRAMEILEKIDQALPNIAAAAYPFEKIDDQIIDLGSEVDQLKEIVKKSKIEKKE